jgi:hypothetical protein
MDRRCLLKLLLSGLWTALAGDNIASGLQMLWSSASRLWLGLVDLLWWLMPLEGSAETFPGWYSVAFGLKILRIPGMGLLF